MPAVGSVSTGKITKNNTTSGVNNISSIGGKKSVVMAIRTTKDNKDVTNKKTVSKVGRYFVDYKSASKVVGKATTLALSTPVTTIVSVHNAGSWSPDAR